MKRLDIDIDNLVKRYLAGSTGHDLARELGVDSGVVYRRLAEAGVESRTRWRGDVPSEQIVERYLAGESEKAVSRAFGVSRLLVRRRLMDAGIKPRGRGASQLLRMSRTSPEERQRLSEAAHAAVRGRPAPEEAREKLALTREREPFRQSATELQLIRMLEQRGVRDVVPQKAIGRYNCDIGAAPVAVEVFGGHWHFFGEHAARAQRRYRYMLDAGWHVLAVWVFAPVAPLTEAAADYVAAYVDEMRGKPAAVREYRMIRGTGQLAASGSAQDDEIALVPATALRRNATNGRYESVAR